MAKAERIVRITLLSDFGTADGYVGAVKGVIAALAPNVIIDDVAHDIPRGDIEAGAWTVARYWRRYPPGTVHFAVVDPGVGSARRALAARVDGRCFVAPDNGILTRVLAAAREVALVELRTERDDVSATFHGRDIFAPVSARLALGARLEELGAIVADPVRFALREPERSSGTIRGEVMHVDRFGDLITNIPGEWCAGATQVRIANRNVGPVRRTYADVASGEAVAVIGSAGTLEIAVRDGSAAVRLAVGRGMGVLVMP